MDVYHYMDVPGLRGSSEKNIMLREKEMRRGHRALSRQHDGEGWKTHLSHL